MRISHLVVFLSAVFLSGCIGPGYATFTPDDRRGHAVIELDVSYLENSMKGDCFSVSALNGIPLDQFSDRRIQRDSEGRLKKVYVLIHPGHYEVTFGYFRNAMYFGGRDTWYADVTKDVDLAEQLYRPNGDVVGEFASLWIEDESGTKVTSTEKALIKKNPRQIPAVVPITVK